MIIIFLLTFASRASIAGCERAIQTLLGPTISEQKLSSKETPLTLSSFLYYKPCRFIIWRFIILIVMIIKQPAEILCRESLPASILAKYGWLTFFRILKEVLAINFKMLGLRRP